MWVLIYVGIISGGFNLGSIEFSTEQKCLTEKSAIESAMSGRPPVLIKCVEK